MSDWTDASRLLESGVVDRVLAVLAMLVAIRPLMRGALGARSHVTWRRVLFLLGGGTSAALGAVGLLALRTQLLGEPFYLPSVTGGLLSFVGGMLGASTVLAGRAPDGLTENAAIRNATVSAAMAFYVAAPRVTLLALGLTNVLRACLPWTLARGRWKGVVEGAVLLALCTVPRDPTLGGLRQAAASLGG